MRQRSAKSSRRVRVADTRKPAPSPCRPMGMIEALESRVLFDVNVPGSQTSTPSTIYDFGSPTAQPIQYTLNVPTGGVVSASASASNAERLSGDGLTTITPESNIGYQLLIQPSGQAAADGEAYLTVTSPTAQSASGSVYLPAGQYLVQVLENDEGNIDPNSEYSQFQLNVAVKFSETGAPAGGLQPSATMNNLPGSASVTPNTLYDTDGGGQSLSAPTVTPQVVKFTVAAGVLHITLKGTNAETIAMQGFRGGPDPDVLADNSVYATLNIYKETDGNANALTATDTSFSYLSASVGGDQTINVSTTSALTAGVYFAKFDEVDSQDYTNGYNEDRFQITVAATFSQTVISNTASISGHSFLDVNFSGKQDSGEPNVAGDKVYIDKNNNGVLDSGETSVLTDSSGNFKFTGLAAGTYVIREIPSSAYRAAVSPPSSGFYTVTLTSGQAATGYNFGLEDAQLAAGMTEYTIPTSGSGISNLATGANGNVFFNEYNADKVGQITKSGTITEYKVPTANAGPGPLAGGQDGNMWFTEFNADKIAKLTPSGAFSEYKIPTANSGPGEIVTGPDGALWFTELNGNKIGRITTAGVITEFTIPTPNSKPYGIGKGADGKMWFTELASHKIGRVTTSGVFQESNASNTGATPQRIRPGPDGNMWYTLQNPDAIGKITPSGAETIYTLPAGRTPLNIKAGPDGAMWFSESAGDRMGRITTSGKVTEYLIPSASASPGGLTVGSDGNVWFAETATNKIGHVSPPKTLTAKKGVSTGTQQLATFTDRDPAGTVSHFSATITWGDGTTSGGTISSLGGGLFAVSASHPYESDGSFILSILIKDSGGSTITEPAYATITG